MGTIWEQIIIFMQDKTYVIYEGFSIFKKVCEKK